VSNPIGELYNITHILTKVVVLAAAGTEIQSGGGSLAMQVPRKDDECGGLKQLKGENYYGRCFNESIAGNWRAFWT
jgi:hypothetical protein